MQKRTTNRRAAGRGNVAAFLFFCVVAAMTAHTLQAAEVTIAWDPPSRNSDGTTPVDVAGYRIYYGPSSGNYDHYVECGLETEGTVSDLQDGLMYYFTVTSYNGYNEESDYAPEISWSATESNAPVVVGDPSSVTVADGDPASFSVVVSGETPLSFQWRRDGTNIPNATTDSLDLGAVSLKADDGATFNVVASNPYGSVTSAVATLTVLTAEQAERRPTLSWEAVDGATWYHLWVYRDGKTYYRKWLHQTGTSWTPDWDLRGGSYSWWIRAWGETPGLGAWTRGGSFDITVETPSGASLVAPCGTLTTNQVTFSCQTVTNATWYYIWVNKDDSTYLRKWVAKDPTYTVAELPFGDYDWWVRTWNPDGYGPWSSPQSFTYGSSTPVAPQGTLDSERLPQFSWTEVEEAEWYHVWLNKDGVKYEAKWIKASTNWSPEAELPGGDYAWWVRTWSSERGHGPWSSGAEFSIAEDVPDAIYLVSPALTATGTTLDYTWDADDAATWYHLRVMCDGEVWFEKWFDTGILEGQVSVAVDGHTSGTEYTWSVQGYGPDGLGAWAEASQFVLN